MAATPRRRSRTFNFGRSPPVACKSSRVERAQTSPSLVNIKRARLSSSPLVVRCEHWCLVRWLLDEFETEVGASAAEA